MDYSNLSKKELIKEIKKLKQDIYNNQLPDNEENYKDLFDNATDLIQSLDAKGNIIYVNKSWKNVLGYSNKEIKKFNIFDIIHPESTKHCTLLFNNIMNNKNYKLEVNEFSFITKKNKKIIVQGYISCQYKEGKVESTRSILRNVTEEIKSKKILKKSLKEKEILLKEVHHRVKNNLQVISSILNLQSSYVKDEKSVNILKESQDRIKTMSFIHESLYRTNDFSKINFSEYSSNLSNNLIRSYGIFNKFIKLKLETDSIYLNLDLSIPCGLILNELISNALKYGFPNKKEGLILIKIRIEKKEVILIVEDNGIGLPTNVDYRNTSTLGLQLVMTLVEQINGTIKLETEKGTKYTITFKQE